MAPYHITLLQSKEDLIYIGMIVSQLSTMLVILCNFSSPQFKVRNADEAAKLDDETKDRMVVLSDKWPLIACTVGSARPPSNRHATPQIEQNSASKAQRSKNMVEEEESTLCDETTETEQRPGRLSLTIHRDDANAELGVVFKYQKGEVRLVSLKETGLLIVDSPHITTELLQVGDILESVNELNLVQQSEEFCDNLLHTLQESAAQSLVFVFRTDSTSPRCQSVLVRPDGFTDNGLVLRRNRKQQLYIARLYPVWTHSVAQKSHLVLSVNGKSVQNLSDDLTMEEVELALMLSSNEPVISIESCNSADAPPWRRAVVGIGGGTLVGLGSILMVTPLHPVGHAMALGGVGLLGTEFQAPKKAMEYTKRRFSWRRKDSATTESTSSWESPMSQGE